MLEVHLEFSFTYIAHSLATEHLFGYYLGPNCNPLLAGELQHSPVFLAPLFSLYSPESLFLPSTSPALQTPFLFAEHKRPLYEGALAPSTNHTLPSYTHGLFPRLQISSSHGSLPWTTYLKLKLSGGTPCPPLLLYFSPDHIIPHYTQFCLLSHPIS